VRDEYILAYYGRGKISSEGKGKRNMVFEPIY
jgi:hypothetical protein